MEVCIHIFSLFFSVRDVANLCIKHAGMDMSSAFKLYSETKNKKQKTEYETETMFCFVLVSICRDVI